MKVRPYPPLICVKTCRDCGVEKDVTELVTENRRGRVDVRPWCKECKRAWMKSYNSTEKRKADRKSRNVAKRDELIKWFAALKEASPCLDCGQSYRWYVMDYHHRDRRTKRAVVYKVLTNTLSKTSTLREIAKCDLLCSNCHRERTFGG